jgi:hypothetical protein
MADPREIQYRVVAQVSVPDENGYSFLSLVITIDCPVCGVVEMVLPGHHLKRLRDLLTELVDEFPVQTGNATAKREFEQMTVALRSLDTSRDEHHGT